MKNFDIENNLNPFLVKGAFIKYNNEICEVTDMTKTQIVSKNQNSETIKIGDKDWEEIELNNDWLNKFGLEVGSNILNSQTHVEWIIKSTGKYFYLTVKRDNALGDNPVIGIKTVHELQEWFYRLTLKTLSI